MKRIPPFLLVFLTMACSGTDGKNALQQLVNVSDADPLDCPQGGYVLQSGLDANSDGTLDASEIQAQTTVCNGADGTGALLVLSPEPEGSNCPYGGQRVDSGLDTNGDGILDAGEIQNTAYVCNGVTTLMTSSVEAPGPNCPQGGEKIVSGQDSNGNGTLDPEEAGSTLYICHGSNGADTLTVATMEGAGENCASGGQKLEIGQDHDGDGTLSPTELFQTVYICNGDDGISKICAQTRVGEYIILKCNDGTGANIYVGLAPSSGTFINSGQALGAQSRLAIGDLDGDGDLDLYVGRSGADGVFLNNGSGSFFDTGQALGTKPSSNVQLGDLDGDCDLDAFVTHAFDINEVWFNDGMGNFTLGPQVFPFATSSCVALGDLDGDGDLDAFVGNAVAGSPDRVWLNDGTGVFVDSGQTLGNDFTGYVALADLDGDGDLDAMVNIYGNGWRVWLNDGTGVFTPGDEFVSSNTYASRIALGDVDGDGDIDAFIGFDNGTDPNLLLLNDGDGNFTDSGQTLGIGGLHATLADLDGDGDLDLIGSGTRVWRNNGSGLFTDSGQLLTDGVQAVGDLDGDGDLDAVLQGTVWFNN
ncbi:VCBS repeat-containing protein [Myxococcota bacterium]|nr:VCBS repeat-containing protein [Myxococcota bacterium]